MERPTLLRHIPLFRDLSDADLQRLLGIAKEVNFDKGQKVFSEGTIGDSLFAIKSGSVRVLKKGGGGNEEVASLSYGQHFGEMALVDDETRSATVETAEPTKLIQIKRGDLENLLEQDVPLAHQVYKALAKYLCRRLRQTTKDLTFVKGAVKEVTERLNKLDFYTGSY